MGSGTDRLNLMTDKHLGSSVKKRREADSAIFGKYVFSGDLMRRMLSPEVYAGVLSAMQGKEKLRLEDADALAEVVKKWAMSFGVTHFCHWFLPLTGASAEKHDAFIERHPPEGVLETFTGKQLVKGEPDASSFPSGGLRCTYEARGYTSWDPGSPIFLWKGGGSLILCIPSVFFSWTGEVLDSKIPLLRAEFFLNEAALRLTRLCGIEADRVHSTLGIEQEYFVVDRALRGLRQDLVLAGRTVTGAPPAKGQELQDHYLGAVQDKILAYMQAFEVAAVELGIPVKTRHNEVAPAQHEVVPSFENSSAAIDHNILLMELMRRIAGERGLACLLHEKPFAGVNGSGKHCNWSLSTDTGINLLNPSDSGVSNRLHFFILLTAVLHGVHTHAELLRASAGSLSNDYRLGGHEAPPAIISVYIGQDLEDLLEEIEEKGTLAITEELSQAGCNLFSDLAKETTDRNRTSPFAFTGNKFEFRAVGSSANPSFSVTVLNLIAARSLNLILDEIEEMLQKNGGSDSYDLSRATFPVLKKYLTVSKPIRFSGDNYSEEWKIEAFRRGLPNVTCSAYAFKTLTTKETVRLFDGVLSESELKSRQLILTEHYVLHLAIEVRLMISLFRTQIFPGVIAYQKMLAESLLRTAEALSSHTFDSTRCALFLKRYHDLTEKALGYIEELEQERDSADLLPFEKKVEAYAGRIRPKMAVAREAIDTLEQLTDNAGWPLPKYWELLFKV